MKKLLLTLMIVCVAAGTAFAQDVREAAKKAEADRQEAEERAKRVEQEIINDKTKLLAEVQKLEAEQATLEGNLDGLHRRITGNEKKLGKLEEEWARKELEFREISGNVRVVARDLETVINQSPLTATKPDRVEKIQPLLRKGYFPDISDITGMTDVLFDEIVRSGQVGLIDASYTGRDGRERQGKILTLGKFTAMYQDGDEVGFLDYSVDQKGFVALVDAAAA